MIRGHETKADVRAASWMAGKEHFACTHEELALWRRVNRQKIGVLNGLDTHTRHAGGVGGVSLRGGMQQVSTSALVSDSLSRGWICTAWSQRRHKRKDRTQLAVLVQ